MRWFDTVKGGKVLLTLLKLESLITVLLWISRNIPLGTN